MGKDKVSRREFLETGARCAVGAAAAPLLKTNLFSGPYLKNGKLADKVIVLGFDGMDPNLLRQYVAQGDMPNFKRLMETGHFGPLGTTQPPQSPVAWSSFITGTNPGGHGIFDFIHRDPDEFTPYLSTTRSHKAKKSIDLGDWSFPISGGKVELLRRGPAFWNTLEAKGIPASLYKLPANFPVPEGDSRMVSGMGTPDVLGTYGTFTYYSDVEVPGSDKFTGGRVVPVKLIDHAVRTKLHGPPNSFRGDGRKTDVEIAIHRDPWEKVARISIQGQEVVLKQGEWSEWIPIKFQLMPMFASVSGMVRLYMQEVHPHFRLYLTPINIDPMVPILPICNPSGYSSELSQAVGRFYTQGFPEDTKALSHGVFSNEEFLAQAKIVFEERLKGFHHQFNDFKEGFFFYYFSSIDQNTHMMWRLMDPDHPLYEPSASKEVKQAVRYFYKRLDDVVRVVLDRADSRTVVMAMSDHGFAPFGREVNLSTWLVENGFTVLHDPDKMEETEYFNTVDWSRTKAYVMGLNGIYVNVEGRERNGSVPVHAAEKVKQEIIAKLEQLRDPQTGGKVLVKAYDSQQLYSGPYLSLAPDIVVGYRSGYRISDQAVLGKFPKEVVRDRVDKWSADHCMDWSTLPGVLLTNREVGAAKPALWDLAPTILNAFGLQVPAEMEGKPIFKV